jgi:IS30 family transposase
LNEKTAEEMLRAAVLALGAFSRDNGLENALHGRIDAALGTASYFCKPYYSWEKGGN